MSRTAPGADVTIGTVDIGRQHLRVATRAGRGSSTVPLLLCNGIGASLEVFLPLMEALDDVGTIAFDVPGTGGSPRSPEPLRMHGLAEVVARMAVRLGHAEVNVLGVSWGGLLAQQLAGQYSQQVRKLVLAATGPGFGTAVPNLQTMLRLADPRRYSDHAYLEQIAPDIYGGAMRAQPELAVEYLGRARRPSFFGYYGQVFAAMGWSSLPWLHRLPQPTLVLAGNDDPLVSLDASRQLAERIPDARLHVFDDGHLFMMTSFDQVLPILRAFLHEDPERREPVNDGR
jgi:poly(3-hydroxyalkanoate) depolymerase